MHLHTLHDSQCPSSCARHQFRVPAKTPLVCEGTNTDQYINSTTLGLSHCHQPIQALLLRVSLQDRSRLGLFVFISSVKKRATLFNVSSPRSIAAMIVSGSKDPMLLTSMALSCYHLKYATNLCSAVSIKSYYCFDISSCSFCFISLSESL